MQICNIADSGTGTCLGKSWRSAGASPADRFQKGETGDAVPELEKLIELSRLFSCSIGVLLKEDMEAQPGCCRVRRIGTGFALARYIIISRSRKTMCRVSGSLGAMQRPEAAAWPKEADRLGFFLCLHGTTSDAARRLVGSRLPYADYGQIFGSRKRDEYADAGGYAGVADRVLR